MTRDAIATGLGEGDFEHGLAGAGAARALALERLGRLDEALAACAVAAADPRERPLALLVRSAVHARRGERMSALEALREAAALTPGRAAIGQLIASLGGAGFEAPQRAEVVELFDRYAPRFDDHLVHDLGYRGHEALVAALAAGGVGVPRGGVAVDLGCGTGLCGPGLRPLARRLIGVDVSPAMLDVARGRGCYDALVEADLVYALATWPDETVDIFVAADVLGYVGDLGPTLIEAARACRPGGVFAFTVEASDGPGWRLGPARRAAYGEDHLREGAARAGLTVERLERAALRREEGEAVGAWLAVFTR